MIAVASAAVHIDTQSASNIVAGAPVVTDNSCVLSQEVGWFDQEENSSGAIAARLSTDTLYIRGAVGDQLGLIIQTLVTIVAAYIIAFTASWKMTLVITATVPLLGSGAWINAKFMMGYSSKVRPHCTVAVWGSCRVAVEGIEEGLKGG